MILQERLPTSFRSMMKFLMHENQFAAFMESYDQQRGLGLRIHPHKLTPEQTSKLPFYLTPIPWCKTGYYYSTEDFPGRHPYHAAGLYYIQEPSAMAVVECLELTETSIVLDLCAAPGGKSTQIASYLGPKGLLISNEIHPARAKILSENLERWGCAQSIILNETPQKLRKQFPEYFTHILVDAPCSGEGMFRKDPDACDEWSLDAVHTCVERQKEIVEQAIAMLQPGGVMVYSTCTFNPFENEQMLQWIVETFPACTIEPIPIAHHIDHGEASWTDVLLKSAIESGEFDQLQNRSVPSDQTSSVSKQEVGKTGRLWPHHIRGEGHFVARIRKSDESKPNNAKTPVGKQPTGGRIPQAVRKVWESFIVDTFHLDDEEVKHINWIQQQGIAEEAGLVLFGDHVYLCPRANLNVSGVKVTRPGVYLGQVKTNRFEPGHGLALAVDPKRAKRTLTLTSDSSEVIAYLKGESIHRDCERGWTLVTVDGYPIGFGKSDGKTVKNHYPKGLRWNLK